MKEVSRLITHKLETMVDAADPDAIFSKHKAITAFFLHATRQQQDGRREMLDTFLRTARASANLWGFMWHRIKPPMTRLLDEKSSVSLKRAAILASPYFPWGELRDDEHFVQLWAAGTSTIPYTNEVVRSVADTLLQISSNPSLQPQIPVDMWMWLNQRPSLPPVCTGRYWGRSHGVFQTVRSLGDAGTLTSYLILVWSEWEYLEDESLLEMYALLREDFGGTWVERHRTDLLQHLDHVLAQLDLGLECLQQYDPRINEDDIRRRKGQYMELKEVLLEVERGAIDELIREFPRSESLFGSLNFCGQAQDVTRHSCVRSLSCVCSYVLGILLPMDNPAHQSPSIRPRIFHGFIMQFFPQPFHLPLVATLLSVRSVNGVGHCGLAIRRYFRFREVCVLRFGTL